MKVVFIVIALALATGAYFGLRAQRDPIASHPAASEQSSASSGSLASRRSPTTPGDPPPAGETVQRSKAPWSEWSGRYQKRDYAWLVANARSNPVAGSYTFAMRALSACDSLLRKGSLEQQIATLQQREAKTELREARIKALRALAEPCLPLGDVDTIHHSSSH